MLADKLAESFYCSFELPVATLRPFNTFGPRQSARAVIPTILSQALTGDTIHLGLLTPVRDLLYVEDTVSAFLKVAESAQSVGQVFNAGTGRGVSMGELAALILAMFPTPKQVLADEARLRPAKSEVMALVCDHTKAREVLGWQPQYTLEQGLERTLSYVERHLHQYKATIFNR